MERVAFLSQADFDAYRATGWMPRDGAFITKAEAPGDVESLRAILSKAEDYRAGYRRVAKRSFEIVAVHAQVDRVCVVVEWGGHQRLR